MEQRTIARVESLAPTQRCPGHPIKASIAKRARDQALIDLASGSKLRACDMIKRRVRDVLPGAVRIDYWLKAPIAQVQACARQARG